MFIFYLFFFVYFFIYFLFYLFFYLFIFSYALDTLIGRGNFAHVWKAHHTLSPQIQVAIKVIDKTQRTEPDLTKIHREISILKTLRHPNIIKLYQVFESGNYIFLGKFSFFSATTPHLSQWITGIGHPQYLCRETPQSLKR